MCVGGNSLRRPSNVWYAKSWWTCKRKAITSGMNDWTRRLQGVVLFFLGGTYCRNGICGRVNNSASQKWFGLGVNDSWQYLVFTASLCDCSSFALQPWKLSGVQKRFQPSTLTFQVGEKRPCFTAISPKSSWKINTNLEILKKNNPLLPRHISTPHPFFQAHPFVRMETQALYCLQEAAVPWIWRMQVVNES